MKGRMETELGSILIDTDVIEDERLARHTSYPEKWNTGYR